MNKLAYFILETEGSRTTQQIAAINPYLMLLCRSHRHIEISKDTQDRKDMQGHEAMVNWIFPSQSKVQTAKNY